MDMSRSVEVALVPVEAVPGMVHEIAPLIDRLLQRGRGEFSLADVLDRLLEGYMRAWTVSWGGKVRTVCLCSFVHYPQVKYCEIEALVGENREAWLDHLEDIEDWARAEGCAAVLVRGRKAWKRLLPDYEETHIVLRKAL